MDYSHSNFLFEENLPEGRFIQVLDLIKKMFFLPFFFLSKVLRTVCYFLGLVTGLAGVIFTFGLKWEKKEALKRKVTMIAEEIADWVLYPFAIVVNISKSFLRIFFKNIG